MIPLPQEGLPPLVALDLSGGTLDTWDPPVIYGSANIRPVLAIDNTRVARYAAGTREILECWFEQRPIREEYLIVDGGRLAGTGATSYTL